MNIPKDIVPYIPKNLLQNAEYINQRMFDKDMHWEDHYYITNSLLQRYAQEAKLVITTALHCASPCIALGIPVILLQDHPEQSTRFSMLQGIIKPHTIQDFRQGNINFSPTPPNIEPLKQAMITNLHLSIQKALGKEIDIQELEAIRRFIETFKI